MDHQDTAFIASGFTLSALAVIFLLSQKKTKINKATLHALLIVIAALIMCCAGCSRNGYGCKGRSSCITRVR
jgi:uncharacterized membrane protein YidH (DUF202 family)